MKLMKEKTYSVLFTVLIGIMFVGFGVSSLSRAGVNLPGTKDHLIGGYLEIIGGVLFVLYGLFLKFVKK